MRPWVISKEIPFQQWMVDRVEEVKLPFKLISHNPVEKSMADVDCEEVKKLKEEVERLKKKNTALGDDLQSLRQNYTNVKVKWEEKTKVNERLVKKWKVDENYIIKITQDLIVFKAKLASRAREWDMTLHSECQWKKSYDEVKQDKHKVLKELYDLQVRFNNTESRMKEIMTEYEERMKDVQ